MQITTIPFPPKELTAEAVLGYTAAKVIPGTTAVNMNSHKVNAFKAAFDTIDNEVKGTYKTLSDEGKRSVMDAIVSEMTGKMGVSKGTGIRRHKNHISFGVRANKIQETFGAIPELINNQIKVSLNAEQYQKAIQALQEPLHNLAKDLRELATDKTLGSNRLNIKGNIDPLLDVNVVPVLDSILSGSGDTQLGRPDAIRASFANENQAKAQLMAMQLKDLLALEQRLKDALDAHSLEPANEIIGLHYTFYYFKQAEATKALAENSKKVKYDLKGQITALEVMDKYVIGPEVLGLVAGTKIDKKTIMSKDDLGIQDILQQKKEELRKNTLEETENLELGMEITEKPENQVLEEIENLVYDAGEKFFDKDLQAYLSAPINKKLEAVEQVLISAQSLAELLEKYPGTEAEKDLNEHIKGDIHAFIKGIQDGIYDKTLKTIVDTYVKAHAELTKAAPVDKKWIKENLGYDAIQQAVTHAKEKVPSHPIWEEMEQAIKINKESALKILGGAKDKHETTGSLKDELDLHLQKDPKDILQSTHVDLGRLELQRQERAHQQYQEEKAGNSKTSNPLFIELFKRKAPVQEHELDERATQAIEETRQKKIRKDLEKQEEEAKIRREAEHGRPVEVTARIDVTDIQSKQRNLKETGVTISSLNQKAHIPNSTDNQDPRGVSPKALQEKIVEMQMRKAAEEAAKLERASKELKENAKLKATIATRVEEQRPTFVSKVIMEKQSLLREKSTAPVEKAPLPVKSEDNKVRTLIGKWEKTIQNAAKKPSNTEKGTGK